MFTIYVIDNMMMVSKVWLDLIVTKGQVVYITWDLMHLYNLKAWYWKLLKIRSREFTWLSMTLLQLQCYYSHTNCYWKRSCFTRDFQWTYILLQKLTKNSRRSWHYHNSSLSSINSYESNHCGWWHQHFCIVEAFYIHYWH